MRQLRRSNSPERSTRNRDCTLARSDYDALLVHGYWSITKLMTLLAPRRRTRILLRGDTNLLRQIQREDDCSSERCWAPFSDASTISSPSANSTRSSTAIRIEPKRITIAPFAVDNDYFKSRSSDARQNRTKARQLLGLPQDVPIFLCCAKLVAGKRPLDILRAFVRVRRERRCALAFAGGGDLTSTLQEEAKRHGVAEDVIHLGFRNQSELPLIYGASDVLVLASALEPWGLVVNEALASGMAAVVSDQVGSAPDLVEPEATFPVGDVDALTSILRRLASDASYMSALKAKGQRRIEHWGIRQSADGVIAAATAACKA